MRERTANGVCVALHKCGIHCGNMNEIFYWYKLRKLPYMSGLYFRNFLGGVC